MPSTQPEVVKGHYRHFDVARDTGVRDFCTTNKLYFEKGKLYYELVKPVLVQGTKRIILQDRSTGKLYTGRWAREVLGLPTYDRDVKLSAIHLSRYRVFIQSTSVNRKLVAGQGILYQVPAPVASEAAVQIVLTVWDRLASDTDLI
jgi:hypothetical protein